MSDVAQAPEHAHNANGRGNDISAGTLMRRAREAIGLHPAALAVSLKVPVRKLEALEADRYDDVGDAVFVRGLASSFCRSLKVDPQPVLERLPQPPTPRITPDTEALNTPFRGPNDARPDTWFDRLRQPVPATVLGLLLAAVVIYFVPIPQLEKRVPQAAADSAPVIPQAAALSFVEGGPAVPASGSAPATPLQGVLTDSTLASSTQAATTATPVMATSPAAASTDTPAAAPVGGVLTIRAKGESWVEIVDAKGGVAVRKILAAGEAAGAGGPLPLQVTIGRADQAEVEVRGARYDLRPVSRDNVARFEIR